MLIEQRVICRSNSDPGKHNLHDLVFYIKDYQRGYKWEKKQIEELLDDIKQFIENKKNNDFEYCLQPLVVKEIRSDDMHTENPVAGSNISPSDNAYEVIDGQQRLTTLLLILADAYTVYSGARLPFAIYCENSRSMDKYYIDNARETIKQWFDEKPDPRDMREMVAKAIEKRIFFIWYQVDDSVSSADMFSKINVGKIPLTEAELFKALLISDSPSATVPSEWDNIEQELSDDDFWYFISNVKSEEKTRIDFLVELYARRLKKGKYGISINENILETDEQFAFLVICDAIKKGKTAVQAWEDIVAIYATLRGWYKKAVLRNYIGFLIHCNKKTVPCDIIDKLISGTAKCTKQQEKSFIIQQVWEKLKGINIDDLSYADDTDRPAIATVLLFFNVHTESKRDGFFPFGKYGRQAPWEREHINAQKDEQKLGELSFDERVKHLDDLERAAENSCTATELIEIKEDITKCRDDKIPFVHTYLKLCARIYGDFLENGIGNMALLDAKTNKTYSNDVFPEKRKHLIAEEEKGLFIPVCTRNAFFKVYSDTDKPINMTKWTSDDAARYKKKIQDAINEIKKEATGNVN